MIEKIIKLKNVGLLADAVPLQPIALDEATIFYAENGRGKSTLASIFHSFSIGDGQRLVAKQTIDSDDPPEIEFIVKYGSTKRTVTFSNSNWQDSLPSIIVFDSDFVDKNVYSGFEVGNHQKKALLEFALGGVAVNLKNELNQINEKHKLAKDRNKELESNLNNYRGPFSLQEFLDLKLMEDVDQHLEELKQKASSIERSEHIEKIQLPINLEPLEFDLGYAFKIFRTSLDEIGENAESFVKEHFCEHSSHDIENWVSNGQDLLSENCPFCGQSISGLELIQSYRSYFSKEYKNLKLKITGLEASFKSNIPHSLRSDIQERLKSNNNILDMWMEYIEISQINLDLSSFGDNLDAFRDTFLKVVHTKKENPLDVLGSNEDFNKCNGAFDNLNSVLSEYNDELNLTIKRIQEYKTSLILGDLDSLIDKIEKLEANKNLGSVYVQESINAYQKTVVEIKELDNKKKGLRKELNQEMVETLERYKGRVNELISSFNANFTIDQLKTDYRSQGNPRSNYNLGIRGQSVKLGKRDDMYTDHSFGNVLSEADKRTLAFAFFIAKLEDDPNLQDRIVILDDPVSSLDLNRRSKTIKIIADLTVRCKQFIVLSHDAFFVRDLREELRAPYPRSIEPQVHQIGRTGAEYSSFSNCNIDSICASEYYYNYKLIKDYSDGVMGLSSREVAKAIRPLLEGYLHRKFPFEIQRRVMFGKIIKSIEEADSSSLLANLQSEISEFKAINNYAKIFHHDTNPDAHNVVIVEVELSKFAKRAMNVVHKA